VQHENNNTFGESCTQIFVVVAKLRGNTHSRNPNRCSETKLERELIRGKQILLTLISNFQWMPNMSRSSKLFKKLGQFYQQIQKPRQTAILHLA